METPLFHFDRSKPFYPLVLVYITSKHGLLDLISRGAIDILKQCERHQKVLSGLIDDKEIKHFITGNKTPQLGKLAPKSYVLGGNISIDLSEVSVELTQNHSSYFENTFHSEMMLLIAAGTITFEYVSQRQGQRDPMLQFLRHCRNAAAHGGFLNFKEGMKDKEGNLLQAKWRDIEITPALEKTKLFRKKDESGLIGPGDVLLLLWDIEQKHFSSPTPPLSP